MPLPNKKAIYYKDPKAFIFNLSKNAKFAIKPDEVDEAVYICEPYLVSFANELMIAEDCIKSRSSCYWPIQYAGCPVDKSRGAAWLAGAT